MTESVAFYQDMLRQEPHRTSELVLMATQNAIELNSAFAIALFDLVLAVEPDHIQAWGNRGNALDDLKQFDEALDSWTQALKINPDYVPARVNRGIALDRVKQYDDATMDFQHVLKLHPEHAEAREQLAITHYNHGLLHQREGRHELACQKYRHVLETDFHYPITQLKLSQCLLRLGRLKEGWLAYEWRWKTDQHKGVWIDFSKPVWRGESLAGKTILLWVEQGYGDTFQFSRYIKPVLDLGAKVFLLVSDASSARLFKTTFAEQDVGIILGSAQAGAFDFHCPLPSLPLACQTDSLEKIPSQHPYLFADAVGTQHWRQRLLAIDGNRKKRVGLVWAGGYRPQHPLAHGMDLVRSLHLRELAPLQAVQASNGIQFFSLQLDAPAEQLAQMQSEGWSGPAIIDLTKGLEDWADTAALIANLDLVISCDTAVAHLAAAMGKPTWILSRYNGCWRWLEDRDDSPWYPTVRLFRQTTAGDWTDVVNRVVIELNGLTN